VRVRGSVAALVEVSLPGGSRGGDGRVEVLGEEAEGEVILDSPDGRRGDFGCGFCPADAEADPVAAILSGVMRVAMSRPVYATLIAA